MSNTKLLNRYFSHLKCEAMKSNIHCKLAACIIKNKKLINKPCCNSERNIYHGINYGSIHAEARAILLYFGKNLVYDKTKKQWRLVLNDSSICKKLDLIVIRIYKYDQLGKSRPCYNCLNMMQTVGIRKVYYTTGINDELICEYVKNMVSIASSPTTIYFDLFKNKKNKELYFEELLKKNFPKQIKYINLIYFIEYNYKDVCPEYSYNLIKTVKNYQVIFYNNKNINILESQII